MSRVSPLARRTDPETSKAAADAAAHAATDRERALLAHYEHREHGLSDFELAEIIGRQQTSAGSRRCDLMKPSRGHVPEPWVDVYYGSNGKPITTTSPSGSRCRV